MSSLMARLGILNPHGTGGTGGAGGGGGGGGGSGVSSIPSGNSSGLHAVNGPLTGNDFKVTLGVKKKKQKD